MKLNKSYETSDRMREGYNVNNMADRERLRQPRQSTTRRNLVIEGLKGSNEDEMITNLIHLATEIGAILFKTDIESIFRIGRRDTTNKLPGPVLVCFYRITIRTNILKIKLNLRKVNEMSDVYVNPDEPVEIRRAKAILRKTAGNARRNGEEVELRYDHITIGETTYSLNDLHKLPDKYRPKIEPRNYHEDGLDQACRGAEAAMEMEAAPIVDKRERYATARRRINSINPMDKQQKEGLIRPGERMRITESGLRFSGPTAYPSNLFKALIKYKEKDYNSKEQAYQHNKAEVHDRDDLATTIMQMSEALEMKEEASNIVVTDEWNDQAPDFLLKLFDEKMKQNPHLLERLLETAPLPLMEASKSKKWGGGAPFHSKLYDEGKYPGKNIFGKTATNYRDNEIRAREARAKNGP